MVRLLWGLRALHFWSGFVYISFGGWGDGGSGCGGVGGETVAAGLLVPPPTPHLHNEQLTQGPLCRHGESVASARNQFQPLRPRHCPTICGEWEGVATPNGIIHQKAREAKSGG